MTDPIRLRTCASCQTAILPTLAVCPECGAPQAGVTANAPDTQGTPSDRQRAGGYDPLEEVFAGRADPKELTGSFLRAFLGQHLGCLGTLLFLLFVPALLLGWLRGDVLGTMGGMLLTVGILGLVLTGWLIWLVRPRRRR